MSRSPSPFCFFPATENNIDVLHMTGDVLAFVGDAMNAWDHKAHLNPNAKMGLALVLEACRKDILAVADKLNGENI